VEAVARLREPSTDLAPAQRLLGRLTGDMQRREQAVARWVADGDRAEAAAELRDMAAEAARGAQWARAEALYRRVMHIDSDRASDALALAQALDRQGNAQDALAELRAANDRLGATGRPDASLPFWATAVTQIPEMPEVRQEYGEALLRRGRPAEGAQELIWAADIAGRQGKSLAVGCLLRAAQVFDEMDDLATALRTYDRLMSQAPGDAQVQEHFVGFCLRRGRPDLAAKTLRTLTEYLLSRQVGASPAPAVAALTQLIVLVPDDTWAYEQLAAILAGEGRQQEALNVYRQLAARRPDDAAVAERIRELSNCVGSATPGPATGG
jgi:tetratricopeptide (TPR) repeat protein